MNFFNFGKFVKIREFFFAELTNSQSMILCLLRPACLCKCGLTYLYRNISN